MKLTLRGSCLCGAVRYEVASELRRFYHCHCQRCRKATGAGHSTNLMVEGGKVKWLQGEDRLTRFDVPEAERYYTLFCSGCGSPMPREIPQIDAIAVPAGSLDQELGIRPQARIFWDSRASWSCEDGLEKFAEYAGD